MDQPTQAGNPPHDRRVAQRERLIEAAEAAVTQGGLSALRARDLAQAVGCSLGAIYNLVGDLDELMLLVSQRTMAALGTHLDGAVAETGQKSEDEDLAQLIAWALAYAAFAADHRNRWRALFDFRMRPGVELPAWFAREQSQIFLRLERRLAGVAPSLSTRTLEIRARTLFSAVHGIVSIGLDRKLVALPLDLLDAELVAFVEIYVAGLRGAKASRSG